MRRIGLIDEEPKTEKGQDMTKAEMIEALEAKGVEVPDEAKRSKKKLEELMAK